MKISQVVELLEGVKETHGDQEVCVTGAQLPITGVWVRPSVGPPPVKPVLVLATKDVK